MMRPSWVVNCNIKSGEEILAEFRKLTLGSLIEVTVYNRSPEVGDEVETAVIGSIAGVVAFAIPPDASGLELVLRDCIGSNTLMNHFINAELGPTGHFFRVHLCRGGEENCSTLPGTWMHSPQHADWVNVLGGGMLHSHCWRLRFYKEIDEPWLQGCFTTVNVETTEGQVYRYVRTKHPQREVRAETVAGVLSKEKKLVAKASASSGSRGPEVEILGVTKGGRADEARFIPAPVLPGSRGGAKRSGVMGQVAALGDHLTGAKSSGDGEGVSEMTGNKPRTWRPSSFLAPRMKAKALAASLSKDPSLRMPENLPGPLALPGGDRAPSGPAPADAGVLSPGKGVDLSKLAAAAQSQSQRERKLRSDPGKLLAMRAGEGSSKASSSSGTCGTSKEEILAQVCAALGVDANGKPVKAGDGGTADTEVKVEKEKKKKRRKKKHSRRRRRSSSGHSSSRSSSYSSGSQSPFRFASRSSVGHENAIRETSRRKPGALLSHGLRKMEELVNPAVGASGGEKPASMPPSAQKYLTCLVHVAQKMNLGRRDRQELQTLAQCLDHLACGRLAPLGDILMQRFKAVETAVSTKSWEVAPHMELVQAADGAGVTSQREQELAAKMTLKDAQLRTMMDRSRQSGRRQDGG